MATWTHTSLRELLDHTAIYDKVETARLVDAFMDHVRAQSTPYSVADAKTLLNALKNKRFFDLLVKATEALIESGQDAPVIRRLMAQGLIEQGRLIVARDLLLRLEEQTREDAFENSEARGLLGRIHKQLYVRDAAADSALRTRHMRAAVEWYSSAYVKDRDANYWHGINMVACTMRAQRDSITVPIAFDPDEIAQRTLSTISAVSHPSAWQLATAMEACVARNDAEFALAWALKYVKAPGTDAFELGSTLRQLREVWRLTPTEEPGTSLIPLLEANLLKREGGLIQRNPLDLRALADMLDSPSVINLEVKIGNAEFMKVKWLAQGLETANLVASISDRFDTRIGSGFVVRGDTLHPSLGPKPILVTNSHVLGGPAAPGKRFAPHQEAIVRFEKVGAESYFCKDDLIFTSPSNDLDVSLVALCRDRQLDAITEMTRGLPLRWSAPPPKDDNRQIYVIGHPDAGELAFAWKDTLLLDYDSTRIHYRSSTTEGSSGSAVFDDTWQLVALHHGGSLTMPRLHGDGTYQANEGILMRAIANACRARLASV
jgi:hypothetical protein